MNSDLKGIKTKGVYVPANGQGVGVSHSNIVLSYP